MAEHTTNLNCETNTISSDSINIEQSLIARSISGDMDAFKELYHQHHSKVFCRCMQMLHNRNDAEDATQLTFVQFFRNLQNFQNRCTLSTWLYRIATNECLQEIRRRKAQCRNLTDSLDDVEMVIPQTKRIYQPGKTHYLDKECDRRQIKKFLLPVLHKLAPGYLNVLIMRYFLDLQYPEMAALTKRTQGTMKSQLSRSREVIKEDICQLAARYI